MSRLPNSDYRYINVLSKLFEGMEENLVSHILSEATILHVEAGDSLFRQGDYGNSLYIVLSGRFRILANMENGVHKLGEIAEGEPVGEFSIFTKQNRMASAYAMRPSVVMELNEAKYFKIISHHPGFALKLTEILIKRVEKNYRKYHLQVPPKNIAVINLQPENDISPWTKAIEKEFARNNIEFHVYSSDNSLHNNYDEIFKEIENNTGLNFMICSDIDNDWTQKSLIYADLTIVATDFYAQNHIYEIESRHDLYNQNILNKKNYLLLLHPEQAPNPVNTKRWIEHRKPDLHIHLRKNHEGDTARFCRIMTNKAIGLVLGGGGAKGFAHIGGVKAILDTGIPVDIIGGTSAGALYGFGISYFDFDFGKINFHTEKAAKKKLISNDFTIPLVSLLSGKKMADHLKDLYGNTHIEDFWIPSYCVSSNFTTASISVHSSGPAWRKVLASIAIPGVFPPVIIDKELHLDGGVTDNLPIQPMFGYPVGHIISVALSGLTTREVSLNDLPSASALLWDKILRRKKYRLPGLTSIIINSLTLNSKLRQQQNKSEVSLSIELDLKGVSLLDDSKWRIIVQKGYDQMSSYLQNLNPAEMFWKFNTNYTEHSTDKKGLSH